MAAASGPFLGAHWPGGASDGHEACPSFHRVLHAPAAGGVRVVDVAIGGGVAEPPHTHSWPSLMLLDAPAPVEVRLVDARGAERLVHRGRAAPGAFQAMPPEPLHYVRHAGAEGDAPLRALRFEVRPGDGGAGTQAPPAPGVPVQADVMPVGGTRVALERRAYHGLPGMVRATAWAARGAHAQLSTNRAAAVYLVEGRAGSRMRVAGVDAEGAAARQPLPPPADDGLPGGAARPRVWHLGPRECVDVETPGGGGDGGGDASGPVDWYLVEVVA